MSDREPIQGRRRGRLDGTRLVRAAFFAYLLAPIAIVVVVSFSSLGYVAFPIPSLSLRWFDKIFRYDPFMDGLCVSLELAFASTALAALIGVPAALAIGRSSRRLPLTIGTFLLSPVSMPLIVLGYALLFYLADLGINASFLALLIAHTLVGISYLVRTVTGVYRSLPPDYEASSILGAGRVATLFLVTLPLIRPGIFAGALFAFLAVRRPATTWFMPRNRCACAKPSTFSG